MGWSFDDDNDMPREGRMPTDAPTRRWIETLYDLEVREADAVVGELLATLERSALYERALIVVSSDHGEEFWEHEGFEHGHTLYDEVLHVPLIVKPPASVALRPAAERVIETPASLENVYPTILSLCGLPIDAERVTATPLFAADGAPRADVAVNQDPAVDGQHLAAGLEDEGAAVLVAV